jgi:hypothetical protein
VGVLIMVVVFLAIFVWYLVLGMLIISVLDNYILKPEYRSDILSGVFICMWPMIIIYSTIAGIGRIYNWLEK